MKHGCFELARLQAQLGFRRQCGQGAAKRPRRRARSQHGHSAQRQLRQDRLRPHAACRRRCGHLWGLMHYPLFPQS